MERTKKPLAEQVKDSANKKITKKVYTEKDLIPTSSTLLNLACSDTIYGGFGIGKLSNVIGDSSAGKTFLMLSSLAEMVYNDLFKEYELFFDDAEHALEFDFSQLFGIKFLKRVRMDKQSNTAQHFFAHILDRINKNKPFIWVLDSFDAIESDEGTERAKDLVDQQLNGKTKEAGSYKTEKARLASEMFRTICSGLAETKSSLIIISQTRENIGFGAQFKPKVRSGGKALEFFSSHEMWLAVKGREKSKKREIGVTSEIKVTKNKLTGKRRTIEVPIYYDYGIDDIGSMINFMITEGNWKKKGQIIETREFGIEATQKKLIKQIEEDELESKLKDIVSQTWLEIEESLRLNRKSRF